ncbi:MAG: histidine phosphatase family protein [Firmicutes bacterium]|nr:histidine phosphatase family protein [Bacillota bacterium]
MELYLVRHGQSEHNASLTESTDSSLTALGRKQAKRVGERLKNLGPAELYCSPQVRALETADVLRRYFDLRPQVRLKLSERCFCWDEPGLPRSEMAKRFPFHDLPDDVDEDGWARHWTYETHEELYVRMKPVAEQIRQFALTKLGKVIVMVIHGGCGNSLLHHLLCIPSLASIRFHHDNCAISHLRFDGDGRISILSLNDTRHLSKIPDMNDRVLLGREISMTRKQYNNDSAAPR